MDLQHLRASDGTGEAVLAHIQSVRNPGSTVLDLDNVDNWNSKAVVVTGTPNANGFISAAGMKVMYGHLNAGDFIIDGFAPGYVDNGNTTSEVAIVKMTTSWADALVSLLGNAIQDTGYLKTTALDHFFKPSEVIKDYIASGGVLAQTAGLTGSFSDITYYIGGLRYTKTAIANKIYTASKDTYVDIGSDGTVYYTEVANGAVAPALSANRIRVARVVTSGAAITSITQINNDGIGNLVGNTSPLPIEAINMLGSSGLMDNPTAGNFSTTEVVRQTITMVIPQGCTKVLILGTTRLQGQDATNKDITARVDYDSTVSSVTAIFTSVNTFNGGNVSIIDSITVTPGTHTFRLLARASNGNASMSNTRILIIPVKG